MCYGSLDPKYMMRDIQDRVKGVAFGPDKSEEPGESDVVGPKVRLRNLFRWVTRKDLANG